MTSALSAKSKVLFTRHVPYAVEQFKAALLRSAPAAASDVEVVSYAHEATRMPREELLAAVRGCAGVFCLLTDRIDAEFLDAAGPSLRVVSTMSVGYNHIDVAACRARDVRVGNTPGCLDTATAETAVGLTFAARRLLLAAADSARTGGWQDWRPFQYCGHEISGCTVGIVGLGRIGLTYARMLQRGFGCRILYAGPRRKPAAETELGPEPVEFVPIEELFARSDVVSLHVPLTPETLGFVDAGLLGRMRPTAVLINTSRGEVVDQDALVAALEARQFAAAGLDVTTPEPLPLDHPLLHLDNCIVLPHVGSATTRTREAMADLAVANLVAGLTGHALPHEVRE